MISQAQRDKIMDQEWDSFFSDLDQLKRYCESCVFESRNLWFKVVWRPKGMGAEDHYVFAEPFEDGACTSLGDALQKAAYWNGLAQNQDRFYFVVPA